MVYARSFGHRPVGSVWVFPTETDCSHVSETGMSFLCRVPGCGRLLKTALGEQRHVTVVHARNAPSNAAPPLRTYCVESDDGPVATAAALARDVHDPTPGLDETDPGGTNPGGSGVHVVELEAPVFLELSRTLTAHPPSPRRGRTRRRAPSERAKQVRRAHRG